MATNRDQSRRQDRVRSTKAREERHLRRSADSTGQERGQMGDTPPRPGVEPDAHNTRDPKPFPTEQHKSGPGRQF